MQKQKIHPTPRLQTPEKLYRGITLPAGELSVELLQGDLVPGAPPEFDEQGNPVVGDGNEYGVYMTDNPHMSEVSYATPRHGDIVPGSPRFNWRGASQSRVTHPQAGVLFEIDTEGLDTRKPNIKDSLGGVYNNGFVGDEFIADVVPATHQRPIKLTLGPDMLHPTEHFELGEGHEVAVEALKSSLDRRTGRLAVAQAIIEGLPEAHRHMPGFVDRTIQKHFGGE